MRKLLLACMILFAIIALPAGAQNETGTVSAAESAVDSQSVHSSQSDATELDPLTVTILGGDSGIDYASLGENVPSDESPAHEELPKDEADSNLNSLIISSGSASEGNGSSIKEETEKINTENGSEQTSSEELFQTTDAFYQSEAVIFAKPDIPFGDQTTDLEISENEDILAIRREFSLDEKENNSVPGFYSEGSQTQITYIRNDLRHEGLRYSNVPIEYKETANQAGESAAYPGLVSTKIEVDGIRDQYSSLDSNLGLLSAFAENTDTTIQNVAGIFKAINSRMDKLQNPEPKDTDTPTTLPYLRPFSPSDIIRIETPYVAEFNIEDEDNEPKKYAVVVGINQYFDRRSLRASVNDAEEMASLLELYGYEVIKLTDDTEIKPTKHNILDGAITEIKTKQNRGNVVIYFSGHGEKDENGNFYLIPQNASGDPANYISKEELKQYIKDIKDLSLIVDTCYSGELTSIKEDGQLILTSSENGEPSNEIWTKPNSVFTHLLCKAIKETGKLGDEIPLKTSFDKAQRETRQLACSYWQSQNPKIS
jgi:hypothetical protein